MLSDLLQAKEITRLNNVYNKLLKDAGCERVGTNLLSCLLHSCDFLFHFTAQGTFQDLLLYLPAQSEMHEVL